MIILTQRLAKRLRTVFRQVLNLTAKANPTIQLAAGPDGLYMRCGTGQAAVEFHLKGDQPEQTIFIPFDLLADVEGGRDLLVEIELHDGKVTASWQDHGVPQYAQFDAPTVGSENWPKTPQKLTENAPDLLTALRDAANTTDSQSSRYALGYVQLRGKSGEVLATDGRQALVQSGFSFPWSDDVLVPASKAFGSKEMCGDDAVFVGRADDRAVFRVGPWAFWLAIETEGRYPDVVSQIGQTDSAVANCHIPEADRQFLLDNLPRLPVDDEYNAPVTVDLNGHVAVRGKQPAQASCTELVLSASTRCGDAIRVNTNRRYLRRAAQLGFERLYIFDDKAPVLASDERRRYIWALLDPSSSIAPSSDPIRIASAASTATGPKNPQSSRRIQRTMSNSDKSPANGNGSSRHQEWTASSARGSCANDQVTGKIEQATVLRDTLREAASQANELIRTLKRDKKQSRLVRTTLESLKTLQAIDA